MSVRINLLPEARLLRIKNEKTRRLVTVICIMIPSTIAVVLVILLMLLGARNLAGRTNDTKIKDIKNDLDSKKNLEQDVVNFNLSLSESAKLAKNRVYLSRIFDTVVKVLPQGVKMTDFSMSEGYKAKATLHAPGYPEVSTFITALQDYNITFGTVKDINRGTAIFKDVRISQVSKKDKNGEANFDIAFTITSELVTKLQQQAAAENTGAAK